MRRVQLKTSLKAEELIPGEDVYATIIKETMYRLVVYTGKFRVSSHRRGGVNLLSNSNYADGSGEKKDGFGHSWYYSTSDSDGILDTLFVSRELYRPSCIRVTLSLGVAYVYEAMYCDRSINVRFVDDI